MRHFVFCLSWGQYWFGGEDSTYEINDVICCGKNKLDSCARLTAVIFIFIGLHLKLSHVQHPIMVYYKNLHLNGNSAQCLKVTVGKLLVHFDD